MLEPLAEALAWALEIAPGRGVRVIREPMIGSVIPDLLLGSWLAGDAPRVPPRLTWVDAHVCARLEGGGPASMQEITRRLHLSPAAAAASERRLRRRGLVEPAEDGTLRLAETFATGRADVVAVEAKLTRWQDAVAQAASYLTFADRALVVLDGNRMRAWDAPADAAEAHGVGLAALHGRLLRVLVPAPVHARRTSAARVVAVTKLLSADVGALAWARGAAHDVRSPHTAGDRA